MTPLQTVEASTVEGYKNTHTQTHTHRIHDSFFINHPLFDPFNGTFRYAFAVKKVQNKVFYIPVSKFERANEENFTKH